MTSFAELELAPPILRALDREGHSSPTPIQTKAIPPIMAGRDLIGIAQTGTGKTAAFALPILHRLAAAPRKGASPKNCRVLVLSPTRELAQQIAERFDAYGRDLSVRTAIAVGGLPISKQRRALAQGVDVLVATPGRLVDLMETGGVAFADTEVFVLDEADRMLDMGFVRPIRQIAAELPTNRQTLFFSATMPKPIAALAKSFLNNPVEVAVAPVAKTADRVEQRVIHVVPGRKQAELEQLVGDSAVQRALVFARTKRGADRIVRSLAKSGVAAQAIHGDKTQAQRERALESFRSGRTRLLIATDIAARGIDIADVTHVINYDLPNEPEAYVHRIGRTGRAGAGGIAIALCTAEERPHLAAIEKLIKLRIPEVPASGKAASRPLQEVAGEARHPANGQPVKGQPTKGQPTKGRPKKRSRRGGNGNANRTQKDTLPAWLVA